MSDTCSPFPPFGDPWPSCLLPSHYQGSIPGSGGFPGREEVQSLGQEEGMATPVFLPGESPWTEEPGGLQSMGSQRVGHD